MAIDPNNGMCYYILHFSEDQFNNEIYENLYLTNIEETSITVVTFEMLLTRAEKIGISTTLNIINHTYTF